MSRTARNITGKYRHYKNIPVTVLGECRHSETEEKFVMYRHEDTGEFWVRPYDMFFESVTVNGTTQPRFLKVEE
ncbi:MAG: DUF1653 domain-containing protein [Bdellovibrionales bacterium]